MVVRLVWPFTLTLAKKVASGAEPKSQLQATCLGEGRKVGDKSIYLELAFDSRATAVQELAAEVAVFQGWLR